MIKIKTIRGKQESRIKVLTLTIIHRHHFSQYVRLTVLSTPLNTEFLTSTDLMSNCAFITFSI